MPEAPETRYVVTADGVHIAYQVTGNGPLDLVWVPGIVNNIDVVWEERAPSRFFQRLASFSRLMLFDKRGTGLSDRNIGAATLEDRIEDVRAVMEACGSERAVLAGYSEGGPMSIMFAVSHPSAVSHLILVETSPHPGPIDDYKCWPEWERNFRLVADQWGYWRRAGRVGSVAGGKRGRAPKDRPLGAPVCEPGRSGIDHEGLR